MFERKDRRDFLKTAAVGVASAVTASPLLMREVAAAGTMQINPNAKAVLPSGKAVDRRAILSQLGLNPATPADEWLAIIPCGTNSAGLTPLAREQLMKKGLIKKDQMESQKGILKH